MSLKSLLQYWNNFFFKPTSPLPVAVFRIGYGLMVILMLVTQSIPDWDFWYSDAGPVQIDTIREFFYRCPVLDVLDIVPPWAGKLFMWSTLVAAVFLTIGLCTRMSAAYVWLVLTSLDHHMPWNISGSDDMMRLLGFCLIFTYAGEALSVDSWWKRKHHPEKVKTEFWPVGQRMLQIQVAIAYFGAAMAKIGGNQWLDGTAVYYSSHLQDFFNLPVGRVFDSLLVCQLFSWGTLIVETALWSLIWVKELTYWVLLAGVLLHIGIDTTMSLPVFEMLFVVAYVVFIEPADLVRLGKWVQSKFQRQSRLTAEDRKRLRDLANNSHQRVEV